MARVVFLHRLPVSFAVRGRGFTGNGHGERRIIPYQLCSDRDGERAMNVGLFESPEAAESFASRKGWSMKMIDLDPSIPIREVGDGIKRTKSEVKWGWSCTSDGCTCHNRKHPAFRHIDSYRKRGEFDPKAIKASLPPGSSGNVCTGCFHPSMFHTYAGK